jgi:hypothetical protein
MARHPAYPHTWHWGKETASFPDGLLVVKSWVGTAQFGAPHTGCYNYRVAEDCLLPMTDAHREYLRVSEEIERLDGELAAAEKRNTYNRTIRAKYERLSELTDKLLELRRAAVPT